jgi:23S rRNA (adenine1618-N6)-methyltransferase
MPLPIAGISTSVPIPSKAGLHPRNRHRAGYDFARLVGAFPAFASFVGPNAYGNVSIDFADPAAVKALNRALLAADYGVAAWDIPPGYLCPPIPGRADYVHQLADLLAEGSSGVIPRGPSVAMLDVGVGANCIYPIIGVHDYGWRFVGTEIDAVALRNAQQIVKDNAALAGLVECRRQMIANEIFGSAVNSAEKFAASMCNPPFHTSAAEAAAGTQRKVRNLGRAAVPLATGGPVLNFGGKNTERWCDGGEVAFIRRMIAESALRPGLCGWFTTLVSKSAHLPLIERALAGVRAANVRVLPMAQGQKQSRIVAWRFAKS